jgi:uroporphyrinogen-III synthase
MGSDRLPDDSATRLLQGRGVLITRPAHQATHLAELIKNAGGVPYLFPVLEIRDVEDVRLFNALIDRLDTFNLAIFISPNAVNKAINLIRARRPFPATLAVAALGRGSRKELQRFGVERVITPQTQFDSEGLLAMDEMQRVAGKKIVIFRGDGGREVLGDELMRRGAQVEYAECYRRCKPEADSGSLLHHWARNRLHAVTVTSNEALHNLFDLLGKLGQQWLKKTPLFVTHERIAGMAEQLGVCDVIVTGQGDEGLVEGLIQWFARHDKG